MNRYKIVISLLLCVNTLAAEDTIVDIDTFLNSLKVPAQKEVLCKTHLADNAEYMQCLEKKVEETPSIENINFLAGTYALKREYTKALTLYERAIKKGDTSAIYFTAGIYNEALKKPEEALPYFQQIKAYKDSTCQIGGIYSIVKKESSFDFINAYRAKSKTLDFYDDEIDKGNMKAYSCKALYYMSLQEYSNAKDAIEDGIQKNDLESIFLMGQLLDQHSEYGKPDERFEYYERASDLGYQKAAHNLGTIFAGRENWGEAEWYFRREIMLGKTDALEDLAHVYAEQKQYETAEKIYRKLAAFGNYEGFYQAGLMYAESGDEKNYKKAEEIYQECLDNGYEHCASGMGLLYTRQYKEYDKAISYYKLGNKMGDTVSTYNLGILYNEALHNQKNAMIWHLKAVEMGSAKSAFALAHMYENDIKDYPKAIEWYTKATAMGDRDYRGNIYTVQRKIKRQEEKKQ